MAEIIPFHLNRIIPAEGSKVYIKFLSVFSLAPPVYFTNHNFKKQNYGANCIDGNY